MPVVDVPQHAAPERSLLQRMRALERANEVRSYRKDLKAELKRGERPVSAVLLSPAEDEETMKVFDLLLAVPKIGRVKASKFLNRARLSPSKTVGGMSERQRRELAALVRSY